MRKLMLWIVMMLALIGVASAITCTEYADDYNPFERLEFVCDGISADACYSSIYDGQALINARPHVDFGEGFFKVITRLFGKPEAYVSGFQTTNNVSIVEFTTKGLKPDYNYTFQVLCGNEVYQFNSSILWKEPTSLVRGGLYIKDNAYIWIIAIVLLAIIIIFIIWLYNKVRYGK